MSLPRYPEYKNSGVAWLGEVPAHWQTKRLRHVADLNPSKNETTSLVRDTKVSFLPMEAIGEDGAIRLEQTRLLSQVETGYTYFRDGDVAVAKITPCFENGKGAVMRGLLGGIGFGSTELIVSRPRPEHTNSNYLNRIFNSTQFRKLAEGAMYGAGGQKRVPDDFVRNFAMAFPPVAEQTNIATFLDHETAKIAELIAEQEMLIALLAEKRQAAISHAVTKGLNPDAPMKDSGVSWLGKVPAHWDVVALKYLVSSPIIDGPHETPAKHDAGIPFVSAESLSKGFIDFDKIWGHISPEDHAKYCKRYSPKRGDILIVKLGATTGTTAIVETDKEFNVWVPLAAVRLQEGIEPKFVCNVLKSSNMKIAYELNWTYGTQQTLGLGTISNLRIPVPPIKEQKEIVKHLDSILPLLNSLSDEASRGIALLKERRSALISAAVTGKIDVRHLAVAEAA